MSGDSVSKLAELHKELSAETDRLLRWEAGNQVTTKDREGQMQQTAEVMEEQAMMLNQLKEENRRLKSGLDGAKSKQEELLQREMHTKGELEVLTGQYRLVEQELGQLRKEKPRRGEEKVDHLNLLLNNLKEMKIGFVTKKEKIKHHELKMENEVSEDCQSSEKRKDEINKKIVYLNEMIDRRNAEHESLKSKVDSSEKEEKKQEILEEEMKIKLKSLEGEKNRIMLSSNKSLLDLELMLSEHTDNLTELLSKRDSMSLKIPDLEKELNRQNKKKEDLDQRKSENENLLNQVTTEVAVIEGKLGCLKIQVEEKSSDVNDLLTAVKNGEKLEIDLKMLKEDLKVSEIQQHQAESEILALRKVETEKHQLDEVNFHLGQKIDKLEKEDKSCIVDIEDLEFKIQQVINCLSKGKNNLSNNSNENQNMILELKEVEEMVNKTREQCDEVAEQINDTDVMIQGEVNKSSNLDAEVSHLTKERSALEKVNVSLEASLTKVKKDLIDTKELGEKLTDEQTKLRLELSELTDQISFVNIGVNSGKEKRRKKEEENEKLKDDVNKLKLANDEGNKELQHSRGDIKEKQDKQQQLICSREQAQIKFEINQKKLQELNKDIEKVRHELDSEKCDDQVEIDNVLLSLMTKITESQVEISKKKELEEEIVLKIEQADKQIKSNKDAMKSKTALNKELVLSLDLVNKSFLEINEEVGMKEQEIATKELNIKKKEDELSVIVNSIKDLSDQNAEFDRKLEMECNKNAEGKESFNKEINKIAEEHSSKVNKIQKEKDILLEKCETIENRMNMIDLERKTFEAIHKDDKSKDFVIEKERELESILKNNAVNREKYQRLLEEQKKINNNNNLPETSAKGESNNHEEGYKNGRNSSDKKSTFNVASLKRKLVCEGDTTGSPKTNITKNVYTFDESSESDGSQPFKTPMKTLNLKRTGLATPKNSGIGSLVPSTPMRKVVGNKLVTPSRSVISTPRARTMVPPSSSRELRTLVPTSSTAAAKKGSRLPSQLSTLSTPSKGTAISLPTTVRNSFREVPKATSIDEKEDCTKMVASSGQSNCFGFDSIISCTDSE